MKKQFYWLKMQVKFFSNLKMKKLRKTENGESKLLIYITMMLLSLENDGKILFQHVEDSFEEELALQLDEDVTIIKETITYLINQNLVEVNDDEYVFLQVDEMTGGECDSAARVRKHRENKKSQSNTDVTECNKNVTTEKELEKEKDIEKDLDIDKSCVTHLNTNKISTLKDLHKDENSKECEDMLKEMKKLEEKLGVV